MTISKAQWTRVSLSLGLAFVLGSTGSGCSWLFVNGPNPGDEEVRGNWEPSCTTSNALPVLDLLFTGVHIASFGYLVSQDSAKLERNGINQGQAIGMDILWAATFTSSAIWGFSRTSDCRKLSRTEEGDLDEGAQARLNERMRRWEAQRRLQLQAPTVTPPPASPADAAGSDGEAPEH